MANKERESAAAAVESMVASMQGQLEKINVKDVADLVQKRGEAGNEAAAINSFGTAGTAGSLTGCFGTAGTFGSLGATEVATAEEQ